jgi:lipopolysaccharide biosynthesis glycosyltransferase
MPPASVWIGFDPREEVAFAVACASVRKFLPGVPVRGIVLSDVTRAGLYQRPLERRPSAADGDILWDVISDAPCSTEFSCSRFLTLELARRSGQTDGWALFMDCDVLVRAYMAPLFALCDEKYAVMCVKHDYSPKANVKMDGQIQTRYARKNWSSVVAFQLQHPANDKLTLDLINSVPGRELHRFSWLADDEIGALPRRWNHLVGEYPSTQLPRVLHWTAGGPWMRGFEHVDYADEWRSARNAWAASGGMSC